MADTSSLIHRIAMDTVLPWIAVLVLLLGLLYFFAPVLAHFLLFHPERSPLDEPPVLVGVQGQVVDGETEDGVRLRHWWYDAGPGRPAAVVFHGNAGHLGHRAILAEGLLEHDVSVLLAGYRGYGGSDGRPSEEGLYRDGAAAAREASRLAEGGGVVLLGRSLGGAVAARVASEIPVAGLILDSTFTSLPDAARAVYPFLPRFLLGRLEGRFSTRERVEELDLPLLVIHGREDRLVPFEMGETLYRTARQPVEWFPVDGAGHNDLLFVAGAEYFRVVADFVERAAGEQTLRLH